MADARKQNKKQKPELPPQDPQARDVAYDILKRIDSGGAFANLVLGPQLEKSELDGRDRGLVTELVYGTTRMRRACDYAVDRFLLSPVDPPIRTLLRLGAYQIIFLRIPPHAAVSETVELAPKKVRGLVNAVLRRVADQPLEWPNDPTRLSYPDWILDLLARDHGLADATAALTTMNDAPEVSERADGYVQDIASQWVVDEVDAQAGQVVLDVCAAPGGKATGLAASGATVIAGDRKKSRAGLVTSNAERLGSETLTALVADACHPPFAPASFDRVLVDAPCSGLGVLRRRADARWRIEPEAPGRLAELQVEMLNAVAPLVKPGGILVYSVCTVTDEETRAVFDQAPDGFTPIPLVNPERWRPWGDGGVLLPHDHNTDGMAVIRLERVASPHV